MKTLFTAILLFQGFYIAYTQTNDSIKSGTTDKAGSKLRHDMLVTRLRELKKMEGKFGPAYEAIYHAALPWYELWDEQKKVDVDTWMVSPEVYATELADALEQGRNFIAENPGGLFPLVFEKKLPDGKILKANYWLSIPADFPEMGHKFPLIIGLHGSGWLGHKLSFVRGGKSGGRVFEVTPINEGGPWQLDFLNAYLDELLGILPVDPDHVYLQGHSLGAMGTWEWAMNNPERFAAISPRSGMGEPFRAIRLKNVPAWVIHGENDDAVLPGFADQMVNALQACGGSVKYTLLKGVGHNIPSDLDEEQVIDWYLRQTRSHYPVPADPRDTLGIYAGGYSKWEITTLPAQLYWKSGEIAMSDGDPINVPIRNAIRLLFKKACDMGELVDNPVLRELDTAKHTMNLWLAVPKTLRVQPNQDSTAIKMDARKVVRFYYRGDLKNALLHIRDISKEVEIAGYMMSDRIWATPLSLWNNSPTSLTEYCVELK